VRELQTDLLIVGGGVGGCAAAIAATDMGLDVVLTEPTAWIGGQFTSQAVPPDEHAWIEHTGATKRYRSFRNAIREHYRRHHPLAQRVASDPHLNPGGALVCNISHVPRVALAALNAALSWARAAGRLRTLLHHRPVTAAVDADRVRAVTLCNINTTEPVTVTARYVIDASELGDLLPLTGAEHVTGAESQTDTGEPHAVDGPAQPQNMQAITWCLPLGHDPRPDADHTIDKPRDYDFWRRHIPRLNPPWPGPLLSWTATQPITGLPLEYGLFDSPTRADPEVIASLWRYRRIVCADIYDTDHRPEEVTLLNWPQNDYFLGSIIDQPPDAVDQHLQQARQLSLCLAYWLQVDAPRPDGGVGYPGVRMRPELVGTDDGLAMAPYVREARRIQPVFRVTEQHIGYHARDARPAENFHDAVGIGHYRIDLHPSTGGDNFIDVPAMPFQIPLGALLPVRIDNLIPAGKNIGTTHVTNGCYRLHPIEWNIGGVAGTLAAHCLNTGDYPRHVRDDPKRLKDFQACLARHGPPLEWPASVIEQRSHALAAGMP